MSEADFKEWITLADHDADTVGLLIRQAEKACKILTGIKRSILLLLDR